MPRGLFALFTSIIHLDSVDCWENRGERPRPTEWWIQNSIKLMDLILTEKWLSGDINQKRYIDCNTNSLRNQLANQVPRLLPTQKAMNLLIVNLTRCWHDTQVWHDGGGGRVRFVAHNICSCIFVAASIDFLCSPIIRVGCIASRSPWNSSMIGCIKIPAFFSLIKLRVLCSFASNLMQPCAHLKAKDRKSSFGGHCVCNRGSHHWNWSICPPSLTKGGEERDGRANAKPRYWWRALFIVRSPTSSN